MAKIIAQTVGGAPKELTVGTVGDAKAQLGVPTYKATVNGDPADDKMVLEDFDVVNLAPAVKGA